MNEVKAGDLLAVYGTLRGEGRMPMVKPRGTGTVVGKLLHLGGFPGLIQTNEDKEVVVEVYEIEHPSLVTGRLDSYEGYRPSDEDGSMYVRRKVQVAMPDGEDLTAWVYIWNRDQKHRVIESGDWFRRD